MIQSQVDKIKEILSILVGKELGYFTRGGSMGDLGFGELIEKTSKFLMKIKILLLKL